MSVNHEEADTRMIIHTKDVIGGGFQRLIDSCHDTDVLLLLIYHIGQDAEVWMVSDMAKQHRCYPFPTILEKLGEAFGIIY